MPEVERHETPFAEPDIADLLRADLALRGIKAHQDQAALLLAQIALETGRGKACQNFNVGNLSAHDGLPGEWYRPPWFEVNSDSSQRMRDLHSKMLAGEVPRAFRSFRSFPAGVSGYVSIARALGVLDAAETGDAGKTAAQISRHYTPGANVAELAKSLDRLRGEFLRKGLFDTLPKEPPPPWGGRS